MNYTEKKFDQDIIRIKKILPLQLRSITINKVLYGNASFCSGININLQGLKSNTDLKKALELYLHKKLNIREYIIYCLLHEFGHIFRHISGLNNPKLYREQNYWIEVNNNPYITRQLKYWRDVTEETLAWAFVKKYIKRILK
jgi:hypothetical protein